MKIPALKGTIKRRMLINFRVDPEVIQKLLPAPFRPKLHQGYAIAGICLIRLAHIRPAGFPFFLGFSSENAAHRIAVTWTDSSGQPQEGVFIPRRDTDSQVSHLTGGRLFPGEHRLARFTVIDRRGRVEFEMESLDRAASVWVRGSEADALPASSCFASLAESSHFFECGCVGYSPTRTSGRFDGMRLKTKNWRVRPFRVDQVDSSFFNNSTPFPRGSIQFDHALIMRDVQHEWRLAAPMVTS
jgi:hypothetical protein